MTLHPLRTMTIRLTKDAKRTETNLVERANNSTLERNDFAFGGTPHRAKSAAAQQLKDFRIVETNLQHFVRAAPGLGTDPAGAVRKQIAKIFMFNCNGTLDTNCITSSGISLLGLGSAHETRRFNRPSAADLHAKNNET